MSAPTGNKLFVAYDGGTVYETISVDLQENPHAEPQKEPRVRGKVSRYRQRQPPKTKGYWQIPREPAGRYT
jgi:hypothetical protein